MISYFESSILQLSIHKVGNKLLDEHLSLSELSLKTDDEVLNDLLMNYFLKPFEKVNEIYRFDHPTGDLNLNEVYHFAQLIFNDKNDFFIMKFLNQPKFRLLQLVLSVRIFYGYFTIMESKQIATSYFNLCTICFCSCKNPFGEAPVS